jgi:hypothetical protein
MPEALTAMPRCYLFHFQQGGIDELCRKRLVDFANTDTLNSGSARKPHGLCRGTTDSGGTIFNLAFPLRRGPSRWSKHSRSVSHVHSRDVGLGFWTTTKRPGSSRCSGTPSVSNLGLPLYRWQRAVCRTPLSTDRWCSKSCSRESVFFSGFRSFHSKEDSHAHDARPC